MKLTGKKKSSRIDLGLALLAAIAIPEVGYSQTEIAAWAGCSQQRIKQIEYKALRKLRLFRSQELREHRF